MKRLLFGFALLCSTSSWADNTFAIEDFTIKAGEEKEVDLIMYNDVTFTAFQLELELPDGVSVKYDDDEEAYCVVNAGRLLNAHVITSQYQTSGSFKIMVYHNANKNLKGNSGSAVLTLTLVASDQVVTGSVTPAITNMEMTAYNSTTQETTKYKPENTSYNCTTQIVTTVTTLGYASFSWPKALDFTNSELTAFIATTCDRSNLYLEPVTKVPANTGLILKGTAGSENTYSLETTDETTDDVSGNLLSSNTTDVYTVASDDIYVLSNLDDGQPGFYRAARGIQVGQYRSYLQYSFSGARMGLRFDEGTTAIVDNFQEIKHNNRYYNLQGQRVNKTSKGI